MGIRQSASPFSLFLTKPDARSLEADTLAEAFYRRLMLCCSEIGRQAEAVDVYNTCKRIFNAELNIEPSPETKAVYERVLREL